MDTSANGGQESSHANGTPAERSGEAAAASGFKVLKEGSAEILLRGNDVFYNKAQIVNRDLSIAVLRAFTTVREEEALATADRKKGRGPNRPPPQSEPKGGDKTSSEPENKGDSGNTDNGDVKDPSAPGPTLSAEVQEPSQKNTEQGEGTKASVRRAAAPMRILEGLAASGLRAMRYACEVPGVGEVIALDKDPVAVEACMRNLSHNKARAESDPSLSGISAVKAEQGDARLYMLTHEKMFDAVDLDPYGSPCQFLDSAVQSVSDGGILLCTATDMAVLCGNNAEVCYSKYGGYPHKAKFCHEMALRILLACIESHANRHKRHIVPLLSVSVDFYIRVFVRIFTSAGAVKASPSKLSWVYMCSGCESYALQRVGRIIPGRKRKDRRREKKANQGAEGEDQADVSTEQGDHTGAHGAGLSAAEAAKIVADGGQVRYLPGLGPAVGKECGECGKKYAVGGPMWSEPLHDMNFVKSRMLTEVTANKAQYPAYAQVHALLTAVSEEIEDVPLFIDLHGMSATLKCTPPSAVVFRSAILNEGFRVSSTHASPLGLKTDAPMSLLWDFMRCWVKKHPVKPPPPGSAAEAILKKEPTTEANFSKAKGALSKAQQQGVPRFLPNPEEYWGPKPRAHRSKNSHEGGAGNGSPERKKARVE